MLLKIFLSIGLLLSYTSSTYASTYEKEPSEAITRELGLRLDEPQALPRSESLKELESFSLFSSDYPSRLFLRTSYPKEDAKEATSSDTARPIATIERLDIIGGQKRSCTFQPFEDEAAARHIKLRSLRNNIEIFEVIRLCKETRDSAMELFVINMTDCQFNRTIIMRGQEYSKYRFTYVEPKPKDAGSFEIFSLDGKDECGSYTCRRTYFIENATLSEPKRFEMLNEEKDRDYRLIFMASSDDGGYFALIRNKEDVRLLSLDYNGSLLGSMAEKIERPVRILRTSTANDAFGFCYTTEDKRLEARCLQLDRKLGVSFNRSFEFTEEIDYMATYNLPRGGGLLMMTARCAKKSEEYTPCDDYEMRLTRFNKEGEPEALTSFREEACRPRLKREFRLYEENDGQICMYYACDCPDGKGLCDQVLRTKCLGTF